MAVNVFELQENFELASQQADFSARTRLYGQLPQVIQLLNMVADEDGVVTAGAIRVGADVAQEEVSEDQENLSVGNSEEESEDEENSDDSGE